MMAQTQRAGRGRAPPLPALGFGAAPLGNMHRALSDAEIGGALDGAWACGMRYFDTAPLYGHGLSEQRLGAFLNTKPRADFVISTKVGRLLVACAPGEEGSGIYRATPPYAVVYDYSYDGVMRSFEASLARTGLDHFDILFVHDIDAMTHGSREAAETRLRELLDRGGWRALSDLRTQALVTAIGAGVNECEACLRLLDLADPDIFLLAGRYTLLDQSAADLLLPRCASQGVAVVAGGPYNSGILATGAVADARYDYRPATSEIIERVRRIERHCASHGVALMDAALQFPLSHPAIVTVIPGSQTRDEVESNVARFHTTIDPAFWRALAEDDLMASEIAAAAARIPRRLDAQAPPK